VIKSPKIIHTYTIDVETVAAAGEDYFKVGDFTDIWQVGITRVSDGETKVWNIKPTSAHYSHPRELWYEFAKWGRDAKARVTNKPELPEVYQEIIDFIGTDGLLIAHNVSFDRSAWEQTLRLYGLDITNHDWFCSKDAFKEAYPGEPARLGDLVNRFTESEYIEEDMHDAGKDSYALYKVIESLLLE
tara:strand:- start:4001 stop:4561 length:561 start_codon:yes stop_codon:yes gene_type:complete